MFCPNCGNQQNGGNVCAKCGSPMNPGGVYQAQPTPQQVPTQPSFVNDVMGYNPNFGAQPVQCTFDGTGGEYFVIELVNTLLLIVTLGFAFPWVVCRNLKWRKEHTIINGRRLAFTGQPSDLLGKWLVWWLLSLVTCGIYAIWLSVRVKEWEAEHTGYADLGAAPGLTFENSFYDGEVGERFGQQLVCDLLMSVTCGIYSPWAVVRMTAFDYAHTVISGDRLVFTGTGASYNGENAIVGILNVISCGLYRAWGICKINKWIMKKTYIASQGNVKMM